MSALVEWLAPRIPAEAALARHMAVRCDSGVRFTPKPDKRFTTDSTRENLLSRAPVDVARLEQLRITPHEVLAKKIGEDGLSRLCAAHANGDSNHKKKVCC
jgi:hypothetical protein